MPNSFEQQNEQIFENPNPQSGNSTYFFLGGIGLIILAIGAFIVLIRTPHGQLSLHLTTTLPVIIAVGLLARGFSLQNLPSRIVVGPEALIVTTNQSTKHYSWSEIGSAATANVLNSNQTCLRITNPAGKTIIRIDESFPDYEQLIKRIESYVDSKPDDTSIRIMSRKATRTGIITFVVGCFLAVAAVFIALETREEQRAKQLLSTKGVPGQGEIVRRFIAPNGVIKRIEFRVAESEVHNVEVDPVVWELLANAKTVPVIFVPEEPDINRLETGQVDENEFMKTPLGGYLFACLGGLMALFMLAYSPLAWMGYDLGFDDKQRVWKVTKLGRVVWASKT